MYQSYMHITAIILENQMSAANVSACYSMFTKRPFHPLNVHDVPLAC